MTVTIRPYNKGGKEGWEVDLVLVWPDGRRHRERKKAPMASKSAARRWGEERERYLLQHGPAAVRRGRRGSGAAPEDEKEVPTLKAFAPRYMEGFCLANQQKPSTIYGKQRILEQRLVPLLGDRRLDEIRQEDIQRIKSSMGHLHPRTVNLTLGALSSLLRAAEEWGVIDLVPVRVKRLKAPECTHDFYDFDAYEDLVVAAGKVSPETLMVTLLGGDAGLRMGEIAALEWTSIDLARGHLVVEQAEWRGHVGAPKSGKPRRVPMTKRLTLALRDHRHLRGPRVLYRADGRTVSGACVRDRLYAAQRQAVFKKKGPHILRHTFCSHLAMLGATAREIQLLAGHADLSTTQRYMHLSPAALERAIGLLDRRQETGEIRRDDVDAAMSRLATQRETLSSRGSGRGNTARRNDGEAATRLSEA